MNKRDLFCAAQVPLLGMITHHVRAVVLGWDDSQKTLTLRYYFDYEPTEEDDEMVSDVLGEIISHFWSEVENGVHESIFSSKPFNELERLDGWLFMRKE